MPSLFSVPRNVSPRLRNLQICQLSIVGVTIVSTLLTAVVPSKNTAFTFSLLYSLILTSITTTILIRKEQIAAAREILTKDKYAKYQLYKLVAAFCMGTVGFLMSLALPGHSSKGKGPNAGNGLWINGVKVNTFHWIIIWTNILNWVFIWASLLYSCCMTSTKNAGPSHLEDNEANIALDQEYRDETENDEAIARQLQADDPNWQV